MSTVYLPKDCAEYLAGKPKGYLADLVRKDRDGDVRDVQGWPFKTETRVVCKHCGIRLRPIGAPVCDYCKMPQ